MSIPLALAGLLAAAAHAAVPAVPDPPPLQDGIAVRFAVSVTTPPAVAADTVSYAKNRVVISDSQTRLDDLRKQIRRQEELLAALSRSRIEFAKMLGLPYTHDRDGETFIDGKDDAHWRGKLEKAKEDLEQRAARAKQEPREYTVMVVLERLQPAMIAGKPVERARVLAFNIPYGFSYPLNALSRFDFDLALRLWKDRPPAEQGSLLLRKNGAVLAVEPMRHDTLVPPLTDVRFTTDPERWKPTNKPVLW